MPRWSSLVGCAVLLLLINTAYIAVAASPTVFYMANVVLHVGLGAAVWVLAAAWLRRAATGPARTPFGIATLALTVAGVLAGMLMWRGNLAELRWALVAHIATGGIAVLALLPVAWRLAIGDAARPRWLGWAYLSSATLLVAACATAWLGWGARTLESDRIVNPLTPPTTMDEEGGGPSSPFFPSSARTNVGGTIPSNFFMDSELCGDCHKDIYEQWKSSVAPLRARSTTSSTGSRSSTCRRGRHRSRASGAPAATITRSSSTAASTGPSRSRSTRRKRRPGWPARRATPSRRWTARWATAASRSSTRRCTSSRPAATR